jgi:hypothetical protein
MWSRSRPGCASSTDRAILRTGGGFARALSHNGTPTFHERGFSNIAEGRGVQMRLSPGERPPRESAAGEGTMTMPRLYTVQGPCAGSGETGAFYELLRSS